MRPKTIADVAQLAGVSKTTVSRVLNAKPDVDEVTAARVRRVVAETGYFPSARAVGLARGRTKTVGMLVPSLTWPWMADVLQGAVDALEVSGYGLLLYTMTRGEESLAQFAAQVSANSFDGLLVIEPPSTIDYITGLHAAGLPVVLIDDRGSHPEFPSVATTNRDGGVQAANHLLGLGCRRLAVVSGPSVYGCTQERDAGFLGSASEHGVDVADALMVEADFTEEGGFRATQGLLHSGQPFDGVFAHNDLMAVGVLRALRDAAQIVPDDVAVIGFDDIPMAAHTEPPLTTIRQPSREMAATAARGLLSRLEGGSEQGRVVLPTSLVIRRSAPEHAVPLVRHRRTQASLG